MPVGFVFGRWKVLLNVEAIEILVPVGAQVQIGRQGFVMIRIVGVAVVFTSGNWIVSLEFDGFNCKQHSVK
jgi:hypothetical protein